MQGNQLSRSLLISMWKVGGVNYSITAAVRNVRSNHCGVSGGFSRLTVAPWGLIHARRRMKWDAEGV